MYSTDIRKRALDLLNEKKMKKTEIALLFGIDRKTLYVWDKIFKKEGRITPLAVRIKSGESRRKLNLVEFKLFLDEHQDWTIKAITQALNVGKTAVETAIKALGYTRKKNSIYSKKEKKKNE